MNTEQERAAYQAWIDLHPLGYPGIEYDAFVAGYRAALQSQPMDAEHWAELHRLRAERGPDDGKHETWKAAAISERVMRVAAEKALQSQDREDAERYQWLRSANVGPATIERLLYTWVNDDCNPPYAELKHGKELDEAIDRARRIEGEGE